VDRRRRRQREIEARHLQQLEGGERQALVAHGQAERGGQVGAGAAAAHRDPAGVDGQGAGAGLVEQPAVGGDGVVERRGEGVLGRQAVAHRHHHARHGRGHGPALDLGGVEVAL
jgi:hypothetical protein